MDTRVYVITHKKYREPEDDLYHTLHVGRALSEDLGYIGDNTGDHISAKNKNYCELTGIYWIWKNVCCDIVGICHYRRYFTKDHLPLTKDFIEKTLEDYDAITVTSGLIECPTVKEQYATFHKEQDLQICREVVAEKYPEYLFAFDLCLSCSFFSLGNMIILRKELYDDYCQWLFDILFEVEARVDISDYDDYQKRIFGFLSERLMRIWLLNHNLRVYETLYEQTDDSAYLQKQKEIQSKERFIHLTLNDLTRLYQQGNYVNLADSSPTIDLNGKYPVWINWWPGEEEMPDIVKLCIQSVKQNLPDEACLHLITMDNFTDYLSFPEIILNRFLSGQMDADQLSRILSMGLLYQYGGLWLDATYFVSKPIPLSLFEKKFFSLKCLQAPWKSPDVARNRWSVDLLAGSAKNPLFQYVLNAFYLYWDHNDHLIDSQLTDYIISNAWENIPVIQEMISELDASNPNCFRLLEIANEYYDSDFFHKLSDDTLFFKLDPTEPPIRKTLVSEDTFYGHFLKRYHNNERIEG